MSNPNQQPLTPAEIEVRVWAFVVGIVTVILAGIVFFMLYSVTFVTQPIKSMAPIDQGYLKMLNDIVLLIVGGIGGVMAMNKRSSSQPPAPPVEPPKGDTTPPKPSDPSGAMPVWVNPELDESWTPPPPPTTPAHHLEPDDEREELAKARAEQ